MMQLHAGIFGGELPVGLGVVFVPACLPSLHFPDEAVLVRDASIQALGRQDAEFGLRHVQPASVLRRVVNLETFRQATGLRRGEGGVE